MKGGVQRKHKLANERRSDTLYIRRLKSNDGELLQRVRVKEYFLLQTLFLSDLQQRTLKKKKYISLQFCI